VNTLVFVPLYVRRGLVERSLIWSWNVFLIWLTLIAAAVPGFLGLPFWAQCVSAVVLTGILGCLVYRVIYSRQEMMKGAGDPRPVVAD
jgi:membrane protein implicated in regulation of membrane protease activity